jgi:hypothetical protein
LLELIPSKSTKERWYVATQKGTLFFAESANSDPI